MQNQSLGNYHIDLNHPMARLPDRSIFHLSTICKIDVTFSAEMCD